MPDLHRNSSFEIDIGTGRQRVQYIYIRYGMYTVPTYGTRTVTAAPLSVSQFEILNCTVRVRYGRRHIGRGCCHTVGTVRYQWGRVRPRTGSRSADRREARGQYFILQISPAAHAPERTLRL